MVIVLLLLLVIDLLLLVIVLRLEAAPKESDVPVSDTPADVLDRRSWICVNLATDVVLWPFSVRKRKKLVMYKTNS